MSLNKDVMKESGDYVFDLFKRKLSPNHLFHNYTHTHEIVESARAIGKGLDLSEHELALVEIAAWFHDVGFVETYKGHEEISVNYAKAFLSEKGLEDDEINAVCNCILATKLPQSPKTILEEVVCDADLSHLGAKNYFEKCNMLRMEWDLMLEKKFTDEEWMYHNINFFKEQRFFTKVAELAFQPQKSANLLQLYAQKKTFEEKKEDALIKFLKKSDKEKAKIKEKPKSKDRGYERYMEVFYRTSSRNHVDFSAIVDQKANIMIQTNALIISIILSLLVGKLDELPNLINPTFLLLITCVGTIIFAILATRPKITRYNTTAEDVKQKKANLLFFGSFLHLSYEDYSWGMKEMLDDKAYYTENMIKDTYNLGLVLGKKYKFLRFAYDIFMYGLIISVLSYAWVFFGR